MEKPFVSTAKLGEILGENTAIACVYCICFIGQQISSRLLSVSYEKHWGCSSRGCLPAELKAEFSIGLLSDRPSFFFLFFFIGDWTFKHNTILSLFPPLNKKIKKGNCDF